MAISFLDLFSQRKREEEERRRQGAPQLSFSGRVRDVFDANSPLDQWKRQQAGQPTNYFDQQRQLGNPSPYQNIGDAATRAPVQVFNASRALTRGIGGLGRIGYESVFGTDQSYQQQLNRVQNQLKQDVSANSGLFRSGVPSFIRDENPSLGDFAKQTVGTGADIASYAIGAGGLKYLKAAPLRFLGTEAFAGASGAGGHELANNPNATPGSVAIQAGIGTLAGPTLATGVGLAGRGVARVARPLANRFRTTNLVDDAVRSAMRGADEAGNVRVNETPAINPTDNVGVRPTDINIPRGTADISQSVFRAMNTVPRTVNDIAELSRGFDDVNQFKAIIEPQLRQNPEAAIQLEQDLNAQGFRNITEAFEASKRQGDEFIKPQNEVAQVTEPLQDVRARADEGGPIATVDGADAVGDQGVARVADTPVTQAGDVPATARVIPELTESPRIDPELAGEVRDVTQGGALGDTFNQLRNEIGKNILSTNSLFLRQFKEIAEKADDPAIIKRLRFHLGSVARSQQAAIGELQSNTNFRRAVGGLDKKGMKNLSDYANARRELANSQNGMETSRSVKELQETVKNANPEMRERFEALNTYYKDLARIARDAGVIGDAQYRQFISDDNYVRIQRDMDEVFNAGKSASSRYSLNSSVTGQRRTGSSRKVNDALDTAMDYTYRIYNEANRNRAAIYITNVLEAVGLARKVDGGNASSRNLIERRVNGQVERFEVDNAFREAAEQLSPYHLGILGKVVALPKRIFASGTTGLRASFTAANFIKDQAGSAILSDAVRQTHGIRNIGSGLKNATKDFLGNVNDEAWDRFIRAGSNFAEVDLRRPNRANRAIVKDVARGRRGVFNSIGNPIRTLEDLIKVTEVATRFQNYKGVYNSAKKKGLTDAEAHMEASLAAWNNSVDFAEAGAISRAINLILPYFNPGVQGSRRFVRALAEKPLATLGKTAGFVGTSVAAATIYNLSSEDRRAVYENLPDYEKDNYIVVIPPGTTQNDDGSYDVIKIPLPFQFGELVNPLRKSIEYAATQDPVALQEVAKDLLGTLTGPINIEDTGKFFASITPQFARPTVQQNLNRDLFTGRDIVSEWMAEESPENQTYDSTSGTVRGIANALNASPIRVEKFIEDTFGRASQQYINASDNVLARVGAIPEDQIGGRSIFGDFRGRFAQSWGIENFNKSGGARYFDKVEKATSGLDKNEQAAWRSLHPKKKNLEGEDIFMGDPVYNPVSRLDVYSRFPSVYQADKEIDKLNREEGKPGNPFFGLPEWQARKVLEKKALPPGAKDPELSNLYDQPWYQDYRIRETAFYDALSERATEEGREWGSNDNPYPETPPQLQTVMDHYSSLPKGTGARSAWIRANPQAWIAMLNQWEAVDQWQNVQRVKRGLAPTEGQLGKTLGYGSGSGFGSGGSRKITVKAPTIKTATGKSQFKVKEPPKITVKRSGGKRARITAPDVRKQATIRVGKSNRPSGRL